jgi:hypothetical protein
MLLAFEGIIVPYARLLCLLNVQVFGTPGRNLYRFGSTGVEVIYREGSISILEEVLARGRPCIALVRTEFLPHWTYSTDHAVVVAGMDGDSVFLNDPAFVQHLMLVKKLEFELAWMEFNYRYCMITTDNTPRA